MRNEPADTIQAHPHSLESVAEEFDSKSPADSYTRRLLIIAGLTLILLLGVLLLLLIGNRTNDPVPDNIDSFPTATPTKDTPSVTTTPTSEISPTNSVTGKLRVCPDEWIDNQMPQIIEDPNQEEQRQYFIMDGKRRELEEFDVEWVEENCDLEVQVVY